MALAKDQIPHDSDMSSKVHQGITDGVNEYHKYGLEEEDGSQSQNTNGLSNDSATTHSPPTCGSGNRYAYKSTNYKLEEAESLINFEASGHNNLMQGSGSLLSFQQSWLVSSDDNLHQGYNQWNQISPRSTTDMRQVQDFNCFQTASGYSSIINSRKEKQHDESSFGLVCSEPTVLADSIQESVAQERVLKKRSSMGDSMQAAKKPCTTAIKTPKPKSSPSKDPQSIAAKNRRERITERLKILQELVPNGTKVDLVTMLEKAINYVKFLQLQVKVLSTDEFWPVQGGKAPDISQVREAIDAILSSQR